MERGVFLFVPLSHFLFSAPRFIARDSRFEIRDSKRGILKKFTTRISSGNGNASFFSFRLAHLFRTRTIVEEEKFSWEARTRRKDLNRKCEGILFFFSFFLFSFLVARGFCKRCLKLSFNESVGTIDRMGGSWKREQGMFGHVWKNTGFLSNR